MRLAFLAAAWLGRVLIGLESSAPPEPLLLLVGGSFSLSLALHLRRLFVFPAVLAVILLLGGMAGGIRFWPDSITGVRGAGGPG